MYKEERKYEFTVLESYCEVLWIHCSRIIIPGSMVSSDISTEGDSMPRLKLVVAVSVQLYHNSHIQGGEEV